MTKEKRANRKQSRLSQANTPKGWAKVRNIAGIVAAIGGAFLATIATGGVALPAVVMTTIGVITATAGTVAGRAALARDKNLIDNDK